MKIFTGEVFLDKVTITNKYQYQYQYQWYKYQYLTFKYCA